MPLNEPIADWRGQVVWLVGASSGIGHATASALHALGAQVIVSARGIAALDAFRAAHPGSLSLPLDVTDSGAMRLAAQEAIGLRGRIDLAVYCAAHYREMGVDDFDLDDALRHQEVNVGGALRMIDAVLPQLLAQARQGTRAHLSLIASVAGYRGLPRALAYGPTKAALINLAEVLYMDLAPRGVAVSLVNPGFVRTPLTAGNDFHMPALLSPEQAAQALLAGWSRGDFEIHFPRRFTMAMKALRSLPAGLYFRAVRRFVGA
ncbi:MAG: SDR family NAD(P)-dependent oxidoreductase [Aquabacterium sp.]